MADLRCSVENWALVQPLLIQIHMKKILTTAVACLALTHSVSMARAQTKEGKQKSARMATVLSLAGAVLPAGLMAAGLATDQPAVTAVGVTSTLFAPSEVDPIVWANFIAS